MHELFKSVAELLEKVESTKKRLQTVSLVAEFLKTLDAEELEPAVSMILGRPFPKWSQKTLDISWASLHTVLKRITQADWNVFIKAFSDTGDVGSAAQALFEKANVKRQIMLVRKQLTIAEVRSCMEAIAQTTGSRSRQKKQRLLEA